MIAHRTLRHDVNRDYTPLQATSLRRPQAVLVGRPCVYGLANAGAVGVAHVLRLLLDELEIAMALCGCATLDQATPALLAPFPDLNPPAP